MGIEKLSCPYNNVIGVCFIFIAGLTSNYEIIFLVRTTLRDRYFVVYCSFIMFSPPFNNSFSAIETFESITQK